MKIKIKQHVALVYRYPILFIPISLMFFILFGLVFPEYSQANTQQLLKSVEHQRIDNMIHINMMFSETVSEPKTFVLHEPDRLVIDFPQASLATTPVEYINKGTVRKAVFKESADKLRAIIYLKQFISYKTDINGKTLNIQIEDKEKKPTKASEKPLPKPEPVKFIDYDDSHDPILGRLPPPINTHEHQNQNQLASETPTTLPQETINDTLPVPTTSMHPTESGSITLSNKNIEELWGDSAEPEVRTSSTNHKQLGEVDFRRDADGNAKIIINLPSTQTIVEDKQNGSSIYLLMKDIDVPQHLRQRLDVLDFATPVNYIEVAQKDHGAKVSIFTKGNIKYIKEQDGSRYTLRVIKKKPKVTKKKKKVFKGEKLSLNFQDIEVRSVLQLLADFTNKNIVVSDTVEGNITLRLKDVPWDQALDIVLETKNLAMRKNGNV
ncbi:MAG TPA: type IV pilus secretin family protein, partial [Thiothrix sp.]|nr:type IV pilus secretin family protein [Thiothrix sp.]